MDEQRIEREGFFGEDTRTLRIDGMGQLRFGFGSVDGGISGSVEDEMGFDAADESADVIGMSEVNIIAACRDDGAIDGTSHGKAALELAAQLARGAEDEDARRLNGCVAGHRLISIVLTPAAQFPGGLHSIPSGRVA